MRIIPTVEELTVKGGKAAVKITLIMKSRWRSFRKSPGPDGSQHCEDVQINTSDGGMAGSVEHSAPVKEHDGGLQKNLKSHQSGRHINILTP
ncbi:hypothetical protein AMELA_G00165210 [Ameiurus melas]|uniref:Uncharacterized protein n=1 Tax=Ameiurus melas TaxID=219545 RepID=A0A7J6AIB4_AMEME|nr:hypothetical protein AMELA_G00165210 [Ameiurus melas]